MRIWPAHAISIISGCMILNIRFTATCAFYNLPRLAWLNTRKELHTRQVGHGTSVRGMSNYQILKCGVGEKQRLGNSNQNGRTSRIQSMPKLLRRHVAVWKRNAQIVCVEKIPPCIAFYTANANDNASTHLFRIRYTWFCLESFIIDILYYFWVVFVVLCYWLHPMHFHDFSLFGLPCIHPYFWTSSLFIQNGRPWITDFSRSKKSKLKNFLLLYIFLLFPIVSLIIATIFMLLN